MKPSSGFHAGPVLLVCIVCGLCIPHTTCGTHFAKTVAPPRPGHQLLSEAHRVGVLAYGLTEVLPFRQSSSVGRGLRVAVLFKDHLMLLSGAALVSSALYPWRQKASFCYRCFIGHLHIYKIVSLFLQLARLWLLSFC